MTERKSLSSVTEYLYNGNGSLISEKEGGKTTSYQYDLLDRQVRVRTPEGREQENLYDGEGLRAGLRRNGKKSTFLFYNGEIIAECDRDDVPVRRHLSGLGLLHIQTLSDGIYHSCYQDEQGSVAYIMRDGGAVENCYDYDAFGNVLEQKEWMENYILYRGQQYDQEAGQYYLRARFYNPVIGRFMQEDTYRGDGLNLYAYCGNNPVMYYDPSGHDKATLPSREPESPPTVSEGEVLTGTVWDNINPTQSNIDGTKIPKSFEIKVNGEEFWAHPNGTKHMGEYINRNAMSHGMPMNSQTILSSFQNAVGEAVTQGIVYEKKMQVGNWELIFSQPRGEGLLPVVKHAVYIP